LIAHYRRIVTIAIFDDLGANCGIAGAAEL
jgi:hypothetical protein